MMLGLTLALLMAVTAHIPENLARAAEGCWELGDGYRVNFRLKAFGLEVDEEARTQPGTKSLKAQPVTYDPSDETLSFKGIGTIHRAQVKMRQLGTAWQFSMSAEISPGKWTTGAWENARPCSPARHSDKTP
jgi:hypothetical protein